MCRITFFGDLVVRDVESLTISERLKTIIDGSMYNVVNFEAPIENQYKPIRKCGPNNSQSKEAPFWAKRNGFNVFGFANNHCFDFGEEGLKKTLGCFDKNSIFGVGDYKEAYTPIVLSLTNGKKVGILAATHKEFGTIDYDSLDVKFGAAWICSPAFINTIVEIRDKVDFLYIYAHAGVEFMSQPLPEWRSVYKNFIDMGCDGVIASHPHIPMGWEFYKGKPILYSLGNFIFQKPGLPEKKLKAKWNDSLCCSIDFSQTLPSLEIIPLHYNITTKSVDVSENDEILNTYLDNANKILRDTDKYMEEVNLSLEKLFPHLNNMLQIKIRYRSFLKNVVLGLLKSRRLSLGPNYIDVLNALQCESHRWAMIRAIKNRENLFKEKDLRS